jgi:Phytanoyl-CoA dioxygenase (PhyH)
MSDQKTAESRNLGTAAAAAASGGPPELDGRDSVRGFVPNPKHTLSTDGLLMPATLLTCKQIESFVRDGFLVISPEDLTCVATQDHAHIFDSCVRLYENSANVGNNILPAIPAVHSIIHDPTVRGALQSLLGSDFMLHPHRHCHESMPGRKGQSWHKDSYFGYRQTRHHLPRWVMAMYYPQDTTLDMGPTGIVPASQYYETNRGDASRHCKDMPPQWGLRTRAMVCKAGSVVLIHYDLWHRGMENKSDQMRFMFKFQFVRISDDTVEVKQVQVQEQEQEQEEAQDDSVHDMDKEQPHQVLPDTLARIIQEWQSSTSTKDRVFTFAKRKRTTRLASLWMKKARQENCNIDFAEIESALQYHISREASNMRKPLERTMTKWLSGGTSNTCSSAEDSKHASSLLSKDTLDSLAHSESVTARLYAVYSAAEQGNVDWLVELLTDAKTEEHVRRSAMYGIAACGTMHRQHTISAVVEAIQKYTTIDGHIAAMLAFCLGEMGHVIDTSNDQESSNVQCVQVLLDLWASLKGKINHDRNPVAFALSSFCDCSAEAQAWASRVLDESWNRKESGQIAMQCCLGMMRGMKQQLVLDQQGIKSLAKAVSSNNRYVCAYAIEALGRAAVYSNVARVVHGNVMAAMRWCSHTTPKSCF